MSDTIKAIMDASGHTEEDAALILSVLQKAGWLLIKPTWAPNQYAAPSREVPQGYSIQRIEH